MTTTADRKTAPRAKVAACVTSLTVDTAAFAAAEAGSRTFTLPMLPPGPVTFSQDSRKVKLLHDNPTLAAEFNAKGRKLPVDIGHATNKDGAAPAVGHVVSLHVGADGTLLAKCKLTAEGAADFEAGKYLYTSPTVRYVPTAEGWHVTGFKSHSMTNNPALEMQANLEADDTDVEDEADEVTETTPETSSTFTAEDVATLTSERDTAATQVTTLASSKSCWPTSGSLGSPEDRRDRQPKAPQCGALSARLTLRRGQPSAALQRRAQRMRS